MTFVKFHVYRILKTDTPRSNFVINENLQLRATVMLFIQRVEVDFSNGRRHE